MPPLSLTGERTLPDVPAENYWFRRHQAVYEWIGRRVRGGHFFPEQNVGETVTALREFML